MILPNIPAVLLAAVRGSCLSRFSRRIESKAQRNLSSGVENTTMTTEFRPLVSEKLSFSVANLNDVQQSGCLGILRDDIQSPRDHVEKGEFLFLFYGIGRGRQRSDIAH